VPGFDSRPTVLRIVLGTQLHRLREAAGITREAAGVAIHASHAKVSRLELGRVGLTERAVADLLTLYGVTDIPERAQILELVRQADTPGWWQQYSDPLPPWFEMYLRLEQAAEYLRTFHGQFIPGLLQSEDYARGVVLVGRRDVPAEEVDRRVELRESRQKRLTEPGAPTLWAVVDEAALRRPIGSPRVMRAQVDHLLEMSELPNVILQVLPFRLGARSAAGGPFTILRFAEPDLPDIVHTEQLTSAVYLDERVDVEPYLAVMEQVTAQAETPLASQDMLRRQSREWE
jgi:transcriptional regulator with XRE-family HTH domain